MILHLVDLPLHQQTVIYIRNWQVPKIAFCPSSSFATRRTNSKTYEILAPFFISICAVFFARQVCKLLLSPQLQNRHHCVQIYALYEPHPLIFIIAHAWTTPYAELPSNEWKQLLRSRETVFYIAFVVCCRRLTTTTNSSENCIQVIRHFYLELPYK